MKFFGTSLMTSSALGLTIVASLVTGCSSSRKHSEPVAVQSTSPGTAQVSVQSTNQPTAQMPTVSASASPADVPADDSHSNSHARRSKKSPANLGAASSGQGL